MDYGAAGLVCDIGGTHARFAIARLGAGPLVLDHIRILPGADFEAVEDAARHYLAAVDAGPLVGAVAACAGPIVAGTVAFTNLPWATTEARFGAAIGLARVHLINDLAAVAWAAPALDAASLRAIGPAIMAPADAAPVDTAPVYTAPLDTAPAGPVTRAILNAGTGCNASAFVDHGQGGVVVVGEYGHASFAPVDAAEVEIWRWLQARFGRVSIERLLSGPGLLNIYHALCAIAGTAPACQTPAEIAGAATRGEAMASSAAARFCAVLGSVAGDVALGFGARGGVFMVGGVAASVLRPEHEAVFRERFEAKGRLAGYLAGIPTLLVQDPDTALMGAARALAALGSRSGV